MNKHLKTIILPAVLAIATSACQQDNLPEMTPDNEAIEDSSFIIDVKFGNKIFRNVECTLSETDSLIFNNETVSSLYWQYYEKYPEMALFLSHSDTDKSKELYEYFPDEKTLLKEKHLKALSAKARMSRGINTSDTIMGRAVLYDDTGFSDRHIELESSFTYFKEINRLGNHKFNDKTSAIKLFNFIEPDKIYSVSYNDKIMTFNGWEFLVCLVSYEDSNFSGKTFYCVAYYYDGPSSMEISRMPHHADKRLAKFGWNDKISSCRLKIMKVSDTFEDETFNPHDYWE